MPNDAPASYAIRLAESCDAPALSTLLDELGFPATPQVIAERLAAMTKTSERVLVAAADQEILGFITVHVMPVLHRPTPVGRLSALVVTSKSRGQGIGRSLVAAAEQELARAGCGLVEVTSNQKLAPAHAFYQTLGYEMTSYRFYKELDRS